MARIFALHFTEHFFTCTRTESLIAVWNVTNLEEETPSKMETIARYFGDVQTMVQPKWEMLKDIAEGAWTLMHRTVHKLSEKDNLWIFPSTNFIIFFVARNSACKLWELSKSRHANHVHLFTARKKFSISRYFLSVILIWLRNILCVYLWSYGGMVFKKTGVCLFHYYYHTHNEWVWQFAIPNTTIIHVNHAIPWPILATYTYYLWPTIVCAKSNQKPRWLFEKG